MSQKTVLLTALLSVAVLAGGGYAYMRYRAAGDSACCELHGLKIAGLPAPALNETQLSGKTEADCPYIQNSKKSSHPKREAPNERRFQIP